MITNPSSIKFKPSTNPLVSGYNIKLLQTVDSTLVASEAIDLNHLPPVDGDGNVSIDTGTLKAQVVAAGKQHVTLTIAIDATGPDASESIDAIGSDTIEFIVLDAPTNVVPVQ